MEKGEEKHSNHINFLLVIDQKTKIIIIKLMT